MGNDKPLLTYTLVTLRLDDANLEIAQSSSAIYVVTDKHPAGFILTTCPAFRTMDDRYTARACLAETVDFNRVVWHRVEFVTSRRLDMLSRFLVPLSGTYDLNPCENDSMMVYVSVLRFCDSRVALRSNLRQAELVDDAAHLHNRRIFAESSPFALVNSALFHGYLTSGNISYVRHTKNSKYATAILSDMRYLDGMEGGIVYLDEAHAGDSSLEKYWPQTQNTKSLSLPRSIGLVVGMLHKMNGEGTMTVVAPWPEVFVALQDYMLQPTFGLGPVETALSTDTPSTSVNHFDGVVMVVVRMKGGQRMWGSGIFLDSTTIVTNKHVVGDDWISISAWFTHECVVKLRYLGAPMEGLDAAFLELVSPVDTELFKPAVLATALPAQGTAARSVGYGLFFPKTLDADFRPLHSAGIIAKVFSMPITVGGPTQPALIVSSAGCWNGSSGGAVFDERTGKVIGMMMSNGKDQFSGEVLPDMSFVIPASIVMQAWDLVKKRQVIACTSQAVKLWKLRETYTVTLK